MTKTGAYQIPYDEHGSMREYAGYGATEWRDNDPFSATMQVVGYERGRSAVRVIMENEATNQRFPMFISDVVDLMMTSDIIDGKVSGTWAGTKKGQNYGLSKVSA